MKKGREGGRGRRKMGEGGFYSMKNQKWGVGSVAVACLIFFAVCLSSTMAQRCSDLGIGVAESVFATSAMQSPSFQFTSAGIMMLTNTGGLYMSFDGGVNWNDQLPFLAYSDTVYGGKRSGVRTWAQQGNVSDTLYIIGNAPLFWVTTNGGKSYKVVNQFASTASSAAFYPSPTLEGGVLALITVKLPSAGAIVSLYASFDYGQTFSLIDRDASNVIWAYDYTNPDTFFYKKCSSIPVDPYTCQALMATNRGNTRSVIYEHVSEIKSRLGFVVVSTYTDSSRANVNLWATTNGGLSFQQLKLSTTIADGSWNPPVSAAHNDFIMINTTRPGELPNGALYIPDTRSGYMTLSASNIVFTRSNPIIAPGGNGAQTMILAHNAYDGPPTSLSNIITKVSYNQGGSWSKIIVSSDCNPSDCVLNFDITQTTQRLDYGSPGIFFTDGNTGSFLGSKSPKTFLTTDWGNSWTTFQDYPSVFSFADGGALSLWGRNDVPTNQIGFSWAITRPDALLHCQFTDNPITITDILSSDDDNSYTSTVGIVFGVRMINSLPVGVIVTLDFSNYPIRQCEQPQLAGEEGSDYELTQPIDPNGGDCILGRSYVFRRKIPEVACYDTVAGTSAITKIEQCACTEEDYECDYCYERDSKGHCALQPGCSKFSIKGLCTNGYSLIEGDMCDDDRGLNRIPSCSTTGGVVVGIVFLLITIGTLVFLYIKNEKFKDFVKGIPSRVVGGEAPSRSSSIGGSPVLAKYETVAQVDEEQSLFNDKENDDDSGPIDESM